MTFRITAIYAAVAIGPETGQRIELIRLGSREHIETLSAGGRLDA